MRRLEACAARLVSLSAACLFVWLGVSLLAVPARAGGAEMLAVALACPAGVEPADCSRENAVDMLVQPVALPTACMQVGEVLATHLSLAPGERHRVQCERRKG